MNSSSPQRHASDVDEQAAYWSARLEGDVLEASERAELDAWLAQSPAHRAALSDYCQFSADLEEQLPQLVASGAVKMPAPGAPTQSRSFWSLPRVSLGLCAAAAAVAVGLWTVRPASPVQTIAAPIGQRSSFTLNDGTRVELNAQTSLRFVASAHERRVQLSGGEAIFMVTKDATRPFIVETTAGSVRVTGTVFNVRSDAAAGAFEVTVVEGSVEVRPANRGAQSPFPLTANQQLTARADGVSVNPLSPVALEEALAWRRGLIVFNDVPLSEVAARFAQYHGRVITVAPELADERVGGRYALDDLMGFLSGMASALSIQLDVGADGSAALRPRSSR